MKRYGWTPDVPDQRDLRLVHDAGITPSMLPPMVSLLAQCPPVYDQGNLGSCTGNAIAAAMEVQAMREGRPAVTPSRLFIYWNERVAEHTTASDAGASIRDGIKSVVHFGVPPETVWPYSDRDPGPYLHTPPPSVYAQARGDRALQYLRVGQTERDLRICLAAGFPVVFGFSAYESLESDAVARSGVLPMPAPRERQIGGHAVLCVGYDQDARTFFVRNSWGASWGLNGYFTMPYDYLLNADLADDLWTIRRVST